MKTIVLFFSVLFLASGCGNEAVKKPDNLIGKDKMINIIYDLALLEAIKSQNPIVLEQNHINPNEYIYEKYKIDSLQFVRSNAYYAADLKEYKKMYEEVNKRLNAGKQQQPSTDPKAPFVQ